MARSPLLRRLHELLGLAHQEPDKTIEEARHESLSRRQFLQSSGAAVGGILLSGLKPLAAFAKEALAGEPVVILGAGVAGLTAAYRLRQAGVASVLYEASPRFGGRMFTKHDFNEQGMFCELGGELVDTYHQQLLDLSAELGLPVEDLDPEDSGGLPRNLYYFGGRAYDEADLMASCGPFIAAILAARKEIFAGGPARDITYRAPGQARRLDQMTLKAFLDSMTGVDKWVRDAFEMAYVTEYGLDAAEQSALNLILLVGTDPKAKAYRVFGPSDEAKRIVGGSGRLPDALARRLGITEEESELFKPRHELLQIAQGPSSLRLSFETPSGVKEISAAQVVCTIPFTRLRAVEGVFGLGLSRVKELAIRDTGYGTNTKLMLSFEGRAWRQPGKKAPASAGGLFWDLPSQSWWETSRLQKGTKGILTNYTGGAKGLSGTLEDKTAALAELDSLHPGLAARFDGHAAQFNWGRYKHNLGSYICARPGEYTTLLGASSEPELAGRLIFAGEHTSLEFSGYMNGGVESGERAAREVLAGRRKPAKKRAVSAAP